MKTVLSAQELTWPECWILPEVPRNQPSQWWEVCPSLFHPAGVSTSTTFPPYTHTRTGCLLNPSQPFLSHPETKRSDSRPPSPCHNRPKLKLILATLSQGDIS